MCCVVEIAMLVLGIMTLVKGQVTVFKGKVVRGAPAYVIGGILTATLPLIFLGGIVGGILLAMKNQGNVPQGDISPLVLVDVLGVLIPMTIVIILAFIYGKSETATTLPPNNQWPPPGSPPPSYPPRDPQNPYDPPHTN